MKIYCWESPLVQGDRRVYAMDESGAVLGFHISSNTDWAKHDIGITSDWKHEIYREVHPDGYELIWLDDPESDQGWQKAFELNQQAANDQADEEWR